MADTRRKDVTWTLPPEPGNVSYDGAQLAVLMDIRDELKRLNNLLWCPNMLGIPQTLKKIDRRLASAERDKLGRGRPRKTEQG